MTGFRASLVAALTAVFCFPAASGYAQADKPTVSVAPQVRDGFADIDAGIRDSIRDIRQALLMAGFKANSTSDDGTLVLIVLGRGIVTNGSVGFGSSSVAAGTGSGFGFVVPNTTPTLTTLLRVGQYERRM